MAAESTSRFAHLLQPIRDLSKVWKIEIAEELEKYIDEVSELVVTNPDDGYGQLNFTEAALLIQGSTAIYSRKVELLYQLVYQALDLLSLDKNKDGSKRGKVVQSGLWAPIPDTDELLTIDHLIKEGRNIMLDESAPRQRRDTQHRVPLFLMPRDAAERRSEFRISTCHIHHTGVYLLQESDAKLLDDIMATDQVTQDDGPEGPLVPAPPTEVQDLDERLQALLRELPSDPAAEGGGLVMEAPVSPAPKGDDPLLKDTPAKQKTPLAARGGLNLAGFDNKVVPAASDPWAMLDDHEVVGTDCPLEVGKTSKRVNAKKLLMNAEGLPDASACEAVADAELWSSTAGASGVAPLLTAGHPVESLFLAVAGHLKAGPKYEAQRAGFSAAWLEFEDLFCQAAAKRRQLKALASRPCAPATPPAGADADGGSDVEDLPGGDLGAPAPATPTGGGRGAPGLGMTPLPDVPRLTEEQVRQEEQRKEVAMLENMIQDAQVKYESTIRQHLASMQKDGDQDKRFPQLYANVKRWQDQLAPVLKEFESRPEFDIHDYSTKFLDKMSNIQKDGNMEGKAIKFSRLVHGQPRYEICRRFLTCLILTNHGNTDIVFNSEEERLNNFSIKLLKAEKKMISLEGEGEAESKAAGTKGRKADAGAPAAAAEGAAAAAAGGRGRKSKASAAPEDGAAAAAAPAARKKPKTSKA